MRVDLAVLADYATVTHDEKLVIVGVFNSISAPTLPAQHHAMYVALRVCSGSADNGSHTLTVRLVDPDGHTVGAELKADFEVSIPMDGDAEGALQLVVGMSNVTFASHGPYAVDILIDERFEETVSLRLHGQ